MIITSCVWSYINEGSFTQWTVKNREYLIWGRGLNKDQRIVGCWTYIKIMEDQNEGVIQAIMVGPFNNLLWSLTIYVTVGFEKI